jgi:hypothetical protein
MKKGACGAFLAFAWYSWCPSPDSNQKPPKYMPEALLLKPSCSVGRVGFYHYFHCMAFTNMDDSTFIKNNGWHSHSRTETL